MSQESDIYKRVLSRRNSEFKSAVKLNNRANNIPCVISEHIANQLNYQFPSRIKIENNWNLVYSTDQHGISYKTLLENVENKGAILIAIRDSKDHVFGAFINQPLEKHPNFYGNGTCFLWKIDQENSLRIFKHSKKEDYFILCDPDFFAVGGGNGKFGLWVSSDLLHGNSESCSTFDNLPLSTNNSTINHLNDSSFTIQSIEMWSLV
ncbi:hypothetical protein BB561_005331 [Smittium simulii]|uniref:Oxidation resistance protein 1 n=1 Tax=Smittium simulii TaxID=133385 RepID=A0A2T9YAV6_9FUNG|nr:hypothetical protein BB561_005331 [Smittium simulii]